MKSVRVLPRDRACRTTKHSPMVWWKLTCPSGDTTTAPTLANLWSNPSSARKAALVMDILRRCMHSAAMFSSTSMASRPKQVPLSTTSSK